MGVQDCADIVPIRGRLDELGHVVAIISARHEGSSCVIVVHLDTATGRSVRLGVSYLGVSRAGGSHQL
jgi:hypothetical protein